MKFELDKEERAKFDEWRKEINKKDSPQAAIGGAYTFSFTPTGLGVIIKVKHISGLELDLTDIDKW